MKETTTGIKVNGKDYLITTRRLYYADGTTHGYEWRVDSCAGVLGDWNLALNPSRDEVVAKAAREVAKAFPVAEAMLEDKVAKAVERAVAFRSRLRVRMERARAGYETRRVRSQIAAVNTVLDILEEEGVIDEGVL